MKSARIVLLMTVLLLLASATLWSKRSEQRPKSTRTPINYVSPISRDAALDRELPHITASPDTNWLGAWTFDGPGGISDPQGWWSVDRRDQKKRYFHVDDFAGLGGGDHGRLVPLEGLQSLWCGTRGDTTTTYCSWATLPGYGSSWEQLFLTPDCFEVTGDVTISFQMSYDMDEDWDFIHVQYDTCDGNWQEIIDFTGIGSGSYSFTVPDSMHNGSMRFRFHFWSDWGWDDQAGGWNSDGAAIIDSLAVSDTSGVVLPTEFFESEQVGDTVTVSGNWEAGLFPTFGDYAALYNGAGLVQEDPCKTNYTNMWAFIKGSTETYACGGFPQQIVVPYGDGLGGRFFMENEIWSPRVPYTHTGGNVEMAFDVYKDLKLSALIFFVWHVRSWVDDCPGDWKDTNFIFYGDEKKWVPTIESLSSFIDPNADSIQVALGVQDWCWNWCGWFGEGQCHSHAPMFDNVKLYLVDSNGPIWSVRNDYLFQDNFPSDGTLTGTVRADMSADRMTSYYSRIRPGDSVVVEVREPQYGLATDSYTGSGPAIYAYVSVHPQGQLGKAGPALTQDSYRFPVVDNVMLNGVRWDLVRLDTVFFYPSRTNVIADQYCVDLNDNLFTPGDTVLFFFGAMNAAPSPDMTYWSEFTGTTDIQADAVNSPMEFTCLPAGGYLRGGDILYVDGADGSGAQPYFDDAFAMLGLEGLVDRYDMRGAEKQADNGLDSRVSNTLAQIVPCYRKIIWNTGDVRYGPGDGTGNNPASKSDDFGLLYTFLENLTTPGGVYLSGDDLADSWGHSYGSSAANFQSKYCNFSYGDNVGGNPAPRPAISPLVIGEPGSFFGDTIPDSLVAYGGCPVIRDVEIVNATGLSNQEMSYYSPGSGSGAVVGQKTENLNADTVGVILSGFSFDAIRDDRPAGLPDRVRHLHRILTWLGNEVDEPTGVAGPAFRNHLSRNYPNPFNPTTVIRYSIKQRGQVSLKIYDVSGRHVKTLVDDMKNPRAGGYEVSWDGRNDAGQAVSSGVYFYKLVANSFSKTHKMVLLK